MAKLGNIISWFQQVGDIPPKRTLPDRYFDTTKALSQIEQAGAWLAEAAADVQTDTIESLLHYHQVSYVNGYHFLNAATLYEHTIGHRLAKMLEDELLVNTAFSFHFSASGPQAWTIQYQKGLNKIDAATISIHRRELTIKIEFDKEYVRLEKEIKKTLDEIEKTEKWIQETIPGLETYIAQFWWRPKKQQVLRQSLARGLDKEQAKIEKRQQDIVYSNERIEFFKTLEQQIHVMKRFEKYGFVIV